MDDISPFSYICGDCGHTWVPRSDNPKRPQCSNCRSRNVSKVDRTAANARVPPSDTNYNNQPTPQKTNGKLTSISTVLVDDPEIREKLKELEIARLDKQIAEEIGATVDPEEIAQLVDDSKVIAHIVSDLKSLAFVLYSKQWISKEEYEEMVRSCPWCGSCSMRRETSQHGEFRWKCQYCGKIASVD